MAVDIVQSDSLPDQCMRGSTANRDVHSGRRGRRGHQECHDYNHVYLTLARHIWSMCYLEPCKHRRSELVSTKIVRACIYPDLE